MISEDLKQFGTDRQIEFIDAVNKYGSLRKAAERLQITAGTIQNGLDRVKRKAAIRGYAPQNDMVHIVPDPFIVRGTSTLYKDGVAKIQWVKTRLEDDKLEQVIKDFVLTLAEGVSGLAPSIEKPKLCRSDVMTVIPMGDPHFGLYAWHEDAGDDFDLDIAEKLTCGAIDRLIASSPDSETALLLNLGDMFHADNQKNVTNSGHQLDVDGRWAKVQQIGLRAIIYCLHQLLKKHDKVIFRINKGNHDGHSSYALALMISCYFNKEPRMEVDLSPSVSWYYKFGKVLIGSTHGDTIKGKDMMSIMAADKPVDWGGSKFRYWYVGHVHHKEVKEYHGGTVEYFRTLAARDAWHQGQGYRAGRDMCAIVLHKEHGEIERHTCDIGMIDAGAANT
jgi:hypothetical protein